MHNDSILRCQRIQALELPASSHTNSISVFSDIDDCVSSPCGVGGDCYDLANAYICDCYRGYTGADCHSICDDKPCHNGTCTLCLEPDCHYFGLPFECNCTGTGIHALLCLEGKLLSLSLSLSLPPSLSPSLPPSLPGREGGSSDLIFNYTNCEPARLGIQGHILLVSF